MISSPHEQRRFKRIPAEGRSGRLLVAGDWHDGQLLDISGGGAAFALDVGLPNGRPVVFSDAELGLISGTVVRRADAGPVIAFEMDEERRGLLVDRLTAWHNDGLFV